jgi:hypothetical protein
MECDARQWADRFAMPTPAKEPSKRRAKEAAKSAIKPIPAAKPFLRFYHSDALREETIAVLTAIERAPDPVRHREALADLVAKLIDSGLDYYFLRGLRLARVGFVVEQGAHIATVGASRVLASVTRNVLVRMDGAQLLKLCLHVRHLME